MIYFHIYLNSVIIKSKINNFSELVSSNNFFIFSSKFFGKILQLFIAYCISLFSPGCKRSLIAKIISK